MVDIDFSVEMFRAGMTRSVSSANLIISFPSVTGWRSDAPTLYEASPSPDPWMKLAVMYSEVGFFSSKRVFVRVALIGVR